MRRYSLIIFLFLFLPFRVHSQENLIQLKAAVHLTSVVSEGRHTIAEIAEIARENGISVVMITDRDLMRWEYGIWPLRKIVKKRVEHNSIFTYGIKTYLEEIKKVQSEFPEMILIPGTESAPFYRWDGSPFRRNLKMYDWHKHILAIGLDENKDYIYLPIIGNSKGLKKKVNIPNLWPLLTLFLGLLYFKRGVYIYTDYEGKHLGLYSRKRQIINSVIILLSIIFLINNWPFFSLRFDRYHDAGAMAYQNYIDYIDKRGGVSFWVHPEAENISKRDNVSFETRQYVNLLMDTKNYAGFSIFQGGYRKVGRPGGVWDFLLTEYCKGIRRRPVWAIGGLAFERGDLSKSIRDLQAIVLVSEKTKVAVLDSLRNGKIYVVKGKNSLDFYLDDFFLSDEFAEKKGFVGDSIEMKGKPTLHIEGGFLENRRKVEIKIIKEGAVIKTYHTETPFEITYCDHNVSRGKSYYRLEIRGEGLHLVTNPIFVDYKE